MLIFECYTEKIDTCHPNPYRAYTKSYQLHKPSGVCYRIKYIHSDYKDSIIYCGEDAVKKFVECMEKEIYAKNMKKIEMKMSDVDKENFVANTLCHICGNTLGNDKVRDHDHLTWKYRGAAHNECNLALKLPTFIPIIWVDMMPIYSWKNKVSGKEKLIVFPTLMKNISAFRRMWEISRWGLLTQTDIYTPPLKTWQKHLPRDKLNATQQCFGEKTELMLRKGAYPYDYIDGPKKLEEKQPPAKEEFFNKLSLEHISDEDYAHAQLVFREIDCQTMQHYHNFYLESDVALLENIFENFSDNSMKTYKFDPAHYFTSPGLSYEAMLKCTSIQLELHSDPDVLLVFENATRGGVSMIFHRHGPANNP